MELKHLKNLLFALLEMEEISGTGTLTKIASFVARSQALQ